MIATDLSAYLLIYLVLVLGLSVFTWLRFRTNLAAAGVVFSGGLLLVTVVVFMQLRIPVMLLDELATSLRNRSKPTIVVGVCAVAASLPWFGLLWASPDREGRGSRLALPILGCSLVGTVVGFGLFLYEETNDLQMPNAYMGVPGFVVEEVATFDINPIRLAIDEERNLAYVSYYTDSKFGNMEGVLDGGVYEVSTELTNGKPNRPRLAVSSPILFRPFGLAVRDGDLYVSRSGVFSS
ncbi:hypothetical protein ACFL2H_13590, partial [Planctomycetota bacterium]